MAEPLAPTVPKVPAAPVSYEDFLAWLDEDVRAEWVDGEIIVMSPASRRHQELARFLTSILQFFVEAHQLGHVLPAPFQMKTGARLGGREPDVLFVADAHADRLRDTFLDGPADLVIEVISPESRGCDRGDKFYEYEQGGVQEYWLIDPIWERAEFYTLGPDGLYQQRAPEDDLLTSEALPGFRLNLGWLWADPLPSLRQALQELGLLP